MSSFYIYLTTYQNMVAGQCVVLHKFFTFFKTFWHQHQQVDLSLIICVHISKKSCKLISSFQFRIWIQTKLSLVWVTNTSSFKELTSKLPNCIFHSLYMTIYLNKIVIIIQYLCDRAFINHFSTQISVYLVITTLTYMLMSN